eukprot:3137537-Pyramimonas_sp.AAC.1
MRFLSRTCGVQAGAGASRSSLATVRHLRGRRRRGGRRAAPGRPILTQLFGNSVSGAILSLGFGAAACWISPATAGGCPWSSFVYLDKIND